MNDSILRRIQVAASFALLLSVPAMSDAARTSFDLDESKVRVSYSDLDLASDKDAAVLYRRLKFASEQACDTGSYVEKGSLKSYRAAKTCASEVLSRLVVELDNEKISKIHKT